MMLEARLTIEGNPRPVPLFGPGPWLIGRAAEADVAFPDDRSCSREQARIFRTDDGFAIQHLSRGTPTAIDGEPIAGTEPLLDGARITFGVQRVVFTLIEAEFHEATMIGRPEPLVASPNRLPLDRGITVGRQDHPGQIVFDHPAVSRRHTAFDVANGSVIVRDLGSTNGTFVNGTRIDRPRPLVPGDRVDIGPFQLTFDGKALISASRVGNAELTVSGISYDVR